MEQKVFFISDLHFGHENVIRFDNRPFETVEEMDAELIRRWNAKVAPGDLVYVLGDMVWKNTNNRAYGLIKSLNGQIILIKGNHDRFLKDPSTKKALAGVKDYDDITVTLNDGRQARVILSHYFIPFYNGFRRNAIHLHGHSHNSEEAYFEFVITELLRASGYPLKIYNVGSMHWNYEPVTLDEILEKGEYINATARMSVPRKKDYFKLGQDENDETIDERKIRLCAWLAEYESLCKSRAMSRWCHTSFGGRDTFDLDADDGLVEFSFECDAELYEQAKAIIEKQGLTMDYAIELFLRAVIEHKGIPFDYTTEDKNDADC